MSIDELNALAESVRFNEFIRVCEARQCKALSKIADDITDRPGVRLILLAGASSAGKTTTAKRLCTQLRVNCAEAQREHRSAREETTILREAEMIIAVTFVADCRTPPVPQI